MMKEHPILFSGEMVKAILNGRKTMTRRVVGNKRRWTCDYIQDTEMRDGKEVSLGFADEYGDWHATESACPYGQSGDRLWVRETWRTCAPYDPYAPCQIDSGAAVLWTADGAKKINGHEEWGRIRPSIFMPHWASRITLEITDVRVERLQDITGDDAKSEGLYLRRISPGDTRSGMQDVWYSGRNEGGYPEQVFEMLWDSINAKRGYGWDVNPWVWVVSFRRIAP